MPPRNTGLGEIVPAEDTFDVGERSEQESKAPSVREALEAAYNKEQNTESEDVESESETADTDLDTGEDEPPARARDEKGRFAKKDLEPESEPGETTEDEIPAQATESAPPAPPVNTPAGWAPDAAPLFNQAPARLQQEILKRESDLRRGFQQASEAKAQVERTWADVEQAFAPYNDQFARAGVSRGQVLNQMMAWQRALDNPQTRAQAFNELARSYGTDLQQLAQVESQRPQEPSYVRELRQQNQQLMGLFQQHQRSQAEQAEKALVNEISVFGNEADATGNKLRPYFETVVNEMVPLLPGLKAQGLSNREILQRAYDQAVWSNPQTRELEIRKRAPKPSKEQIAKARNATKLISGEANGAAAPVKLKGSVRDHLRAHWDKNNGPGLV